MPGSTATIMQRVCVAMLPGLAVATWLFGAGVLVNLVALTILCLVAEAVCLHLRGRPVSAQYKLGALVCLMNSTMTS